MLTGHRKQVTNRVRAYVAVVAATAATALAAVVVLDPVAARLRGSPVEIAVFAVLLAVGELFPVKVLRGTEQGEIATSTTFGFGMLLACGGLATIAAFVTASVLADCIRRKRPVRIVFNMGQYTLTLIMAIVVLTVLPLSATALDGHFLPRDVLPIVLAGLAYFAVNNLLTATVVALEMRVPVWRYIRGDLRFHLATDGVLLAMAPVLVVVANANLLLLPLLLIPVFIVYHSARVTLERERQALTDALTGLPNRVMFDERLRQEVRALDRGNVLLAVLLLDLDRFKEVNDTLGHHSGDLLLKQVGPRLAAALRPSDTIARFGGDEFAAILPSVSGAEQAMVVARRLVEILEEPFVVEDLRLPVEASVGIALAPEHGTTVDALLRRADIAMYRAKQTTTGCVLYLPEQDEYSRQRLALPGELRKAMEDCRLVLHYQPKTELRTMHVSGVEALVRWNHPHEGLLLPGRFLPTAERSGLIGPLTHYVLDVALGEQHAWRNAGLELPVAVNLSARNVRDPDLPEAIEALLAKWETPPQMLELEITESSIMSSSSIVLSVLDMLSEKGIRISIDDFGTGYSSLSHLSRLPVSEIKIDQSFVRDMDVDAHNEIIVRSTIDLGRNLGLDVVAEGVETAGILQLLIRLGCDQAQGFHICRPIPASELVDWVQARNMPNGTIDLTSRDSEGGRQPC